MAFQDELGISRKEAEVTSTIPSHRFMAAIELFGASLLFAWDIWYLRTQNRLGHLTVLGVLAALVVGSAVRRRVSLIDIGRLGGLSAWRDTLLMTLILATTAIAGAALLHEPNDPRLLHPDTWQYVPAWENVARRLAMAAGQQMLLQLVLSPLCDDLMGDRRSAAALLAASLFGLAHLPSPWLAGMSAAGAAGWLYLYDRHHAVVPLIASQFSLSLLVHVAFSTRVHLGMRIGAAALDWQ